MATKKRADVPVRAPHEGPDSARSRGRRVVRSSGLFGLALLLATMRSSANTKAPDCKAYSHTESSMPIMVFRLAPLDEAEDGFSVLDAGKISYNLRNQLAEVADRIHCAAITQQVPITSMRAIVIGGTDSRPARQRWIEKLKRDGIAALEAEKLANVLANISAANARSEVVINELRKMLAEHIHAEGKPENLADANMPDKVALLQQIVPRLVIYEEQLPDQTIELVHQSKPHPRGFAITVYSTATRRRTHESASDKEAPVNIVHLPTTINVHTSISQKNNIRASYISLQLDYLRVLEQDHVGFALTGAWRTDLRLNRAALSTTRGLQFGARLGAEFAGRSYRLTSSLSAPVLPYTSLYAGGWIRIFDPVEFRIAALGGIVLPAAGATISVEPTMAIRFSSDLEFTISGSGGAFFGIPTSGAFSSSAGIGFVL